MVIVTNSARRVLVLAMIGTCALARTAATARADTLTQWNFNSLINDTNVLTGSNVPSINVTPDLPTITRIGGTRGGFVSGWTGVGVTGASSDPASNTSEKSYQHDNSVLQVTTFPENAAGTSTNETAGIEVDFNATGYAGYTLQFDQLVQTSASRYQEIQYSVNGAPFTDFTTLDVLSGGSSYWINGKTFSFGSLFDGAASVRVRIVTKQNDSGVYERATSNSQSQIRYSGANGQILFDMFTIIATPDSTPRQTWTGAASAAWDASSGNFSSGAFAAGSIVTFDASGLARPTIAISAGGVAPAQVAVTNAAGTYTYTGGAMTVSGGFYKTSSGALVLANSSNDFGLSGLNLYGGTTTFSSDAQLGAAGGTVSLTGGATLLSASSSPISSSRNLSVSYGGGTVATTGASLAIGTLSGIGGFTKAGPGLLSVGTTTYYGTVTIAAGSLNLGAISVPQNQILQLAPVNRAAQSQQVLIAQSLQFASGATLDLANNDMIVRAMAEGDVDALLAGGTNSLLGSSIAAASTNGYTGLGAITNSDGRGGALYATFDGVAVSASDVIVKYTYIGDTTLKGYVNATDLANALAGMNGGLTGWENGDFNYDGVVNQTDFNLLLASLAGQGAPLSGSAGSGGAVPEPSVASLGLGAAALAGLRRRRR